MVMSLMSIVAGFFSGRIAYFSKHQLNVVLVAIAVVGVIYFMMYAAGRLFWAQLIPVSAALVYSNFAAIFAGLAAGWVCRTPKLPAWRRGILCGLLACGSLVTILWPLLSTALRPPPQGGYSIEDGVVLQTSWATCSPAAAATLFNLNGIDVSEAEMIPLCFTDAKGTPTLGLYRGVKLIADSHELNVQIIQQSLDELLKADDWPALIAVKLPYGTEDPRYADEWGWVPGLGHSVVVVGQKADGTIVVADPSIGLDTWSRRDMEILWHGEGMRLKK